MYLSKENKSQRTKNTLLQAATSQPTKQSLQESIFSPTQEKLKNKKFPSLQKNKTSLPHNLRQTGTLTGYSIVQMDGLTGQGRRRASANMRLAQWGVTRKIESLCIYLTLVQVDSVVLLSPPLRQAQKR
jgi:hypothetical protein